MFARAAAAVAARSRARTLASSRRYFGDAEPEAEFMRHLSDDVLGVDYHLLGTVHGTSESVAHVEQVLTRYRPHELVLELEPDEADASAAPAAAARKPSPLGLTLFREIIERRGTVTPEAAGRVLVEMTHARAFAARELAGTTRVVAADRSNRVTLQRVFAFERSLWRRTWLFATAALGTPRKRDPPPFALAVASLRTQVGAGVLLGRLVNHLVLIYERDVIFARALHAAGRRAAARARDEGTGRACVVGVFGLAHLNGIEAEFGLPFPDSPSLFDPAPDAVARELIAARWLDSRRALFAEGCRLCPLSVDWADNAIVTRCRETTADGRCARLSVS